MIMHKTFFLFFCGVGLVFGCPSRDIRCWGAPPAGERVLAEPLRPCWQVGQRWVVETTRKVVHVANGAAAAGRPVRWQFTVVRRERVAGTVCFRVEIACRS